MNTNKYIRILALIIGCCLIFTTGCSDNNKAQVDTYIENARKLLSEKKVQTAIMEYRNAVNLDPDNSVVLFELAEAYVLNKQISNAVRYYNLAAKADPDSILAYLRLAQIHMQTNALLEARNDILKALKISPNSMEAYHILSGIQLKERDTSAAIETLEKAAEIDDKNVKTYTSLAILYLKNKKADKAEAAYKKAIQSDSASRMAYMGLVRLYVAQKKWDKAENLLKQVMETPGIKVEKYSDMAMFYQGMRNFDFAETYFQKAVEHDPDNVDSLMHLAEYYTRINQQDKAITTMAKALAKNPKSLRVLANQAQLFLHFNQTEEARKTVEKALKINKAYSAALFQKGRILMAEKNFKAALDIFDQVITQDKLNAKTYYYRGLCIQERGATDRPEQKIFRAAAGMLDDPEAFERDQVKRNFLAAVTIDPRFIDARRRLLEIYLMEKNIKESKVQMDAILKLAPPDRRTMELMSGVKFLEGDVEGAQKILLNIVKEQPNYIPANIRLAGLYSMQKNYDSALKHYRKAFNMAPELVGVVKMMTDIYLSQKQYDKAIEIIEALKTKSAKNKAAFYNNLKGEIYLAAGKPDKAFGLFEKAAAQQLQYITPRMHIARLLLERDKSEEAINLYKDIESQSPDFVPALFAIGIIEHNKDNLKKAEKYYRKVIDIAPGHVNAINNLAFILSQRKEGADEALKLAKIAIEKAPQNADVLDTLGWVYYKKGNYLSALSELEESLKIKPGSALTCFHYGMALYRSQKFEKARKYFEKALKIDPDFKGAQKARQMLN
jgi:tetratricopeptide (TPR) repeat protein